MRTQLSERPAGHNSELILRELELRLIVDKDYIAYLEKEAERFVHATPNSSSAPANSDAAASPPSHSSSSKFDMSRALPASLESLRATLAAGGLSPPASPSTVHRVTQLQFAQWPDKGTPSDPLVLLDVLRLVRGLQPELHPPIFVHCRCAPVLSTRSASTRTVLVRVCPTPTCACASNVLALALFRIRIVSQLPVNTAEFNSVVLCPYLAPHL